MAGLVAPPTPHHTPGASGPPCHDQPPRPTAAGRYDPELYSRYSAPTRRNLSRVNEEALDLDLVEALVVHVDERCGPGAVLVFLPGADLGCRVSGFLFWLVSGFEDPETLNSEEALDLDLVEALVVHIDERCGPGAVLVFLPGAN